MRIAFLLIGLLLAFSPTLQAQPASGSAVLLHVDGAISPATADYVERGITKAGDAPVIILQMDTPGGLDKSMRTVIKAILASPVPVVAYVGPSGSRAASAGTYILYASHVAAMAPGTNLGAATPVSLISPPSAHRGPDGDDKEVPAEGAGSRKAINDAVAYIRSLAEQRGRNADWAERAVRESVSASAQQALADSVIDLIADDVHDLLRKIDGLEVLTASGLTTLRTAEAGVVEVKADWHSRLLAVIADPAIAYLLLLIGLGGLLFEGYSPGAIVPGVVGAISLLLALYALQMLPVNYVGLALIGLGLLLLIAETMVPAYGALGLGGVVAFVFGSVILVDTDMPDYGLPVPLLIGISLVGVLLLAGIIWLALRSTRQPVVSGSAQLSGTRGFALADFERRGQVHILGERWQATSATPLRRGQPIVVESVDGLLLHVRALPESIEGDA